MMLSYFGTKMKYVNRLQILHEFITWIYIYFVTKKIKKKIYAKNKQQKI